MGLSFHPNNFSSIHETPEIEEGMYVDLKWVAVTMLARRQILGWLSIGMAPFAGCEGGTSTATATPRLGNTIDASEGTMLLILAINLVIVIAVPNG